MKHFQFVQVNFQKVYSFFFQACNKKIARFLLYNMNTVWRFSKHSIFTKLELKHN